MDFAEPMLTPLVPETSPLLARVAAIPARSVGVVGGGLAGLACAARLARHGLDVTVYERNERVGGKMNLYRWEGYTWDTGPSLLTMPQVLRELWADLGASLEQDLELERMPVTCLYHWRDGARLVQDAAFWAQPEIAAFLEHARG